MIADWIYYSAVIGGALLAIGTLVVGYYAGRATMKEERQ